MKLDENTGIKDRIEKIRHLSKGKQEWADLLEAVSLARTVVYDTVGGNHPLMSDLNNALKAKYTPPAIAACRSVVTLYDAGELRSPRLAIAHEIEGEILDIAQKQVEDSKKSADVTHKQLQLGIAAFLAGAALEDALRRLCDVHGFSYPRKTTISNLQAKLYQPSKQIEMISRSESKQIIAWGETRNNADHGRFNDIIHSEVEAMVTGVRGFIDRHLP